ncbi:double zinc ribbon domain-containing protein [Paracoccus jiaweipingae]|uniref:double zinc ribbon domain-containing protein n=1 Tax=unclassified Paracoccus (in: a-proteobacteria) TaxID=2688777 RepID=UPI0037B33F45
MKAALQIVYPAQCPCCGTVVATENALCAQCWPRTPFIRRCACGYCGVPLPDDGAGGVVGGDSADLRCDDCLAAPPPWDAAVAAMVYDDAARRMVLALKHGDRPDLAPVLGGWLADRLGGLPADSVIVPIPLHPWRLLKRKYNQAELVAQIISTRLGLDHRPLALVRRRPTAPQGHANSAQRHDNLRDAFLVPPRSAGQIAGRQVVLVDDVMASGATMAAATAALRRAGVARVTVAVLARAVKDG